MRPGQECRVLRRSRAPLRGERLSQQRVHLLLQRPYRRPGLHTPDDVKPVSLRTVNVRRICKYGHRLNRQVVIRRRASQPVAIKSLRRNPYDGYRLGISPKRAAKYRGVSGELTLPGLVTHHRCCWCALRIIGIRKQTPRLRTKPKRPEIISRNKLPHHRPAYRSTPTASPTYR